MNAKPLITIIIPTYNQASYLRQTIASALSQDYERLEVVVADDCSTDGTEAVVASISDPRLRYVRNERNLGRVGNYRSALYDHAKGEWVLNLDGDDLLVDRGFISRALDVAVAKPNTILAFAARIVLDDPITAVPEIDESRNAVAEYFDGTSYVLSLPRAKRKMHHLTVLYDREAAMSIGFYREDILSSDYESLWRLALGKTIAFLPARAGVWRRHRQNASRTGGIDATIRNLTLFDSVREYAVGVLGARESARFDAWLNRNVANRFYGSLCNQIRTGDLASLRKLCAHVRAKYPHAYRKALSNPKTYLKGACAFFAFLAHSVGPK